MNVCANLIAKRTLKIKMKKLLLLLVFIFFILFAAKAQKEGQPLADSLEQVLKRTNISETERVDLLSKLSWEYRNLLPKKGVAYGEQAEKLAKEINYEKKLGEIYLYLSFSYNYYNDNIKSYEFALLSLKYNTEFKLTDLIPISKLSVLNNPNITKETIINSLHNILRDVPNIKDKIWHIRTIGGVGNEFKNIGVNKEADSLINLAIEESRRNNQKFMEYLNLVRLSNLFINQQKYDTAIYLIKKANTYFESINEKRIYSENLANLAYIYVSKFKNASKLIYLDSAEIFADLSFKISSEIEYNRFILTNHNLRYVINKEKGDSKKAMDYLEKFVALNDSIYGQNARSKLVGIAIKQRDEIAEANSKQQTFQRNAFIGGFVLMIILAGVSYRNGKRKQKDNITITKQKMLVETQNKEIKDSIHYALRIQTAILPSHKIVKQYLENSFILYKPKDIVAGDFYWMETVNDLVLFAACDCTGHGVPGAMVSVVCHNALNRAVNEFGLTQPAAILDKAAEIVIENFSKSEDDIKDGMDISLCAYNTKTKTMQWAGANNPLWLLQNGELKETKADKQPIGMNENIKPFTNHTIALQTGETIYLFTDGFADQFGGETGQKKLTKKRFKDLILSVQNKTMQEQGIALDSFITEYKKDIEQIDDILVIGVKI